MELEKWYIFRRRRSEKVELNPGKSFNATGNPSQKCTLNLISYRKKKIQASFPFSVPIRYSVSWDVILAIPTAAATLLWL